MYGALRDTYSASPVCLLMPSPCSNLKVPLSFRLKLKIMMIFQITLLTNTLFIFPFLNLASFIKSVLDQIKLHACFVLFTICTLKKERVSECIFFQNLYGVKLYLCKSHKMRSYFPLPIMHLVCPAQNFELSSISLRTTVVPMRRN